MATTYSTSERHYVHKIFLIWIFVVSEVNASSEVISRVRFFPSLSPDDIVCSWDGLRGADLQRSSIGNDLNSKFRHASNEPLRLTYKFARPTSHPRSVGAVKRIQRIFLRALRRRVS